MSYEGKFVSAVIVAAGMGKRMGTDKNKQYIEIGNKAVLAHTIESFQNNEYIDEIIIVTREEEIDYCRREIVEKFSLSKVKSIVVGGNERQDSVYNGLISVNQNCEIALIHDGARPFIEDICITNSIICALNFKACVVGVKVKDTIKRVDEKENVIDTPDRTCLWQVQTPQAFHYSLIIEAYKKGIKQGWKVTDDSMLVEKFGHKVKMIEGSYENIKITTPEDLIFAKAIIEKREGQKCE